jgi:hypothetical protein
MVAIGNFFFKYRNWIFILFYGALFIMAIVLAGTIRILLLYMADQYRFVHYLPGTTDPWFDHWTRLYRSWR